LFFEFRKVPYIKIEITTEDVTEGGKNTRRGGWIVFSKTFLSYENNTVLRIQSLIEFRVWSEFRVLAADKEQMQERKKTQAIYTGSFHKPEVVLSPLHFQGEFH